MTDPRAAARKRLMTRYAIKIALDSRSDPRDATDAELLAFLADCARTPSAHELPVIRAALTEWLASDDRHHCVWERDPRLVPFAAADSLTWQRHTLFAPHRQHDGTLITGDLHRMPLDTWLPSTMKTWAAPAIPLSENGVGNAVTDPDTLDDLHAAITAWCRVNLGRADVKFT